MTTYQSFSYTPRGLVPIEYRGWDYWQHRLNRYDLYSNYYNNIQYHQINSYADTLKSTESLYKWVRGVYNPAYRLVQAYVSKIYGGALNYDDPSQGAIPVSTDNPALLDAISKLWKDSQWNTQKSIYVRQGAVLGDAFIKVVDDMERQQVRLEVVDPRKIRFLSKDAVGAVDEVQIEYVRDAEKDRIQREGADSPTYIYKERITADGAHEDGSKGKYETFVDGHMYPIYMNQQGEAVDWWYNDYGFVPMQHVAFINTGLTFGQNAFGHILHKINEINDFASIINDAGRKMVNYIIVSNGGTGSESISFSTTEKDQVPVLYNPNDSVDTLAPSISIADGIMNIKEILMEIERDVPELALHRLRESGNATAPGVRAVFDDAIARFQEAMGVFDAGLAEVQKMAVCIGGMRGYPGYEGFSLADMDSGNADHTIMTRPVINDTLSKREKIELTMQAVDSPAASLLLAELDYSQEQIDEVMAKVDERNESFANAQGFAPNQPPQFDDDTEEEQQQRSAEAQVSEEDIMRIMQDSGQAERLAS